MKKKLYVNLFFHSTAIDNQKYDSIIKYFTNSGDIEDANNETNFISTDQRKKLMTIILNFTNSYSNINGPDRIKNRRKKRFRDLENILTFECSSVNENNNDHRKNIFF